MRALKLICLSSAMTLAAACGGDAEKAASGGAPSPREEARAKTLAINLGSEPGTMDPSLVTTVPENKALYALMEGLTVLDGDANALPGVAESWTHDEGFKTWTFKLRKDARWHNGDPVIAGDFVYATQRILTKSVGGVYATEVGQFLEDGLAYFNAGGMEGTTTLTSVTAPDDYTLVYKMTNPTVYFPTVVSFASWYPLNRKVLEAGGATWANSAKTFIGNGAFRMDEYRSGDRIVTKKADTYWDKDAIFWNEIHLYMITDSTTENAAFLSGELDITQTVTLPEIDYWKPRKEFTNPAGLATYYVLFNTQKEPFNDARVRRAFSLAIDRSVIIQRVARRGEIPATTFIPATMPRVEGGFWRDKQEELVPTKGNIEEAKKLLAEAGFGPGGKPLPPIEYSYNTSEEHKVVGEQLQAMWRSAFDVDVRLQNMEFGMLLSNWTAGDFQASRSSWVGDYVDPTNFLQLFRTGNTNNRSRMSNARFDELFDAARTETDPMKREQMLMDAEKIVVVEEAAIAPIYDFAFSILIATDLENVRVNKLAVINYVRGSRAAK